MTGLAKLLAFLGAIVLAGALPSAAHAAWHKAESDNFVIYADDSEDDIRRFAEGLERYHSALELISGRDAAAPSPSNRVTIFAVGGRSSMRNLTDNRQIGGFYTPRAGASKAFVQDIRMSSGYPDRTMLILLHEYAHHFFIGTSRFVMPRWLSEGSAEFFASTSFERDGGLKLGLPYKLRAFEVYNAHNLTAEMLLDPDSSGQSHGGFYGRSWLLYHYLRFSSEREGQLGRYWSDVASGTPSLEAAKTAFGDLDALEKDVSKYLKANRMPYLELGPERLSTGTIRVIRLSEGEAAIMDIRILSQKGADRKEAEELLKKARKVALRYPDDPGVQTALAEAEYDAGNDAEAIAAADIAIAADPSRVNAYVQKGYALFRIAEKAEDEEAAYRAAMEPFAALNSIENDHPLPLIYYYRSYFERGAEPSERARAAIERAAMLAPFDQALWVRVALMQFKEGKRDHAIASLAPVAADPHGGGQTLMAKALLARLESVADEADLDMAEVLKELEAARGSTADEAVEGVSDNEGG